MSLPRYQWIVIGFIPLLMLSKFGDKSATGHARTVVIEVSGDCRPHETCGECLRDTSNCTWCSNLANSSGRSVHCYSSKSEAYLHACLDQGLIHLNAINIIRDEPFDGDNSLHIKPQAIVIKQREGEFRNFSFQIRLSKDVPLDLYFLFDISNTMLKHINQTAVFSSGIAQALLQDQEASQVRFGFGTFVDKPLMPFVYDEKRDFNYKHMLNFTRNVEDFQTKVMSIQTLDSRGDSEGGLEALLQVALCRKQINGNPNNRMVVVFITDSKRIPKFAGDGKLTGTVVPSDLRCHLDRQTGIDSSTTAMDYPSVAELDRVLVENRVATVFASDDEATVIYTELKRGLKSQVVVSSFLNKAEAVKDEIIKAYLKLQGEIKLDFNTSALNPEPKLTVWTDCGSGQEKQKTKHCTEVPVGKTIDFDVNLNWSAAVCEDKPQPTRAEFRIGTTSLSDFLSVTLELICGCPSCESGDGGPPPSSGGGVKPPSADLAPPESDDWSWGSGGGGSNSGGGSGSNNGGGSGSNSGGGGGSNSGGGSGSNSGGGSGSNSEGGSGSNSEGGSGSNSGGGGGGNNEENFEGGGSGNSGAKPPSSDLVPPESDDWSWGQWSSGGGGSSSEGSNGGGGGSKDNDAGGDGSDGGVFDGSGGKQREKRELTNDTELSFSEDGLPNFPMDEEDSLPVVLGDNSLLVFPREFDGEDLEQVDEKVEESDQSLEIPKIGGPKLSSMDETEELDSAPPLLAGDTGPKQSQARPKSSRIVNRSKYTCSGNGLKECGVCRCDPGWLGENCECSEGQSSQHCLPAEGSYLCSNRGKCVCGSCRCDEGYTGSRCEFVCPVGSDTRICSGNGKCVKTGQCICHKGWYGPDCSCAEGEDNAGCLRPGDTIACSGHGKCNCGQCECDSNEGYSYKGKFCELCPTCRSRCMEFHNCVECRVKNDDLNACAKECSYNVSRIHQSKIAVYKKDAAWGEDTFCTFRISSDCEQDFFVSPENKRILIVIEQSCKEGPNTTLIVGLTIGITVLVGLLGIIALKFYRMWLDHVEFDRFRREQEATHFEINENATYRNPNVRHYVPEEAKEKL